MALISEIKSLEPEKVNLHDTVECHSFIFEKNTEKFIQLNTYGLPNRKIPGKISQTIQFNQHSAQQRLALIYSAFPELK